LLQIRDASELLEQLLDGEHSSIAGRLVGAYCNLGQMKIAEDILKSMKTVGYEVREYDPFLEATPIKFSLRERSPYINQIKLMWAEMRKVGIEIFSEAPGISKNKHAYLDRIEKLFITDAYHSLSIEQYTVTPELIEKVRLGN
jgi:hypothetical protein